MPSTPSCSFFDPDLVALMEADGFKFCPVCGRIVIIDVEGKEKCSDGKCRYGRSKWRVKRAVNRFFFED